MKNHKLNESLNDSEDFDFLNEKTEPIFRPDIMIQKLDRKKILGLSQEISNRKKLLNRMFDARLGKFFFDIKPESLIIFEKQLKKYFFSPNSKFLDNFPRLRKKLHFNNNINDIKLSAKINMGSLLYFSEANKKLIKKGNINTKEKIINFSKNFSTNYTKDIINNEIYKVKFWDKNAKRINKLLSKKNQDKKSKNIIDNNEIEDEKKIDLLKFHSQKIKNNNFINKNLTRNIENEYFRNTKPSNYSYSIDYFINKNKNKKYIEEDKSINNNTYNYVEPNINNNSQNNITKSMINLNDNKISLMKSYLNNLKYYKHNISKSTKVNFLNNIKTESSFPSLTFNINDKSSYLNKNILKTNNSYISRNDQKFKEAKNNLFKSTFHNTNKSIKELIESSIKYKRNLTEKVKKLNKHMIKCNLKLCKLIDNINKNSKLKKKKIKKFDIKKDISDDDSINNKKKGFNYYEHKKKLKSKTHKAISISNLLRETKKNLFHDNIKILKKEFKLFPKKVLELNDHYALTMVERLYSASKIDREKSPDDEEKMKEKKDITNNYKIVNLKKMNKINHDKIIKMGEVLIQEKDRLFKQNKKIQNII